MHHRKFRFYHEIFYLLFKYERNHIISVKKIYAVIFYTTFAEKIKNIKH